MLPFELTKDTPYLALSGELWSVFYEYFNRNWSCYKGFPLYIGMSPVDQHALIELIQTQQNMVAAIKYVHVIFLMLLVRIQNNRCTPPLMIF